MSDTNRVAIGIIKEVTAGITPATPAFQAMRITGSPNLANSPQVVTSNELAPDRQISDRPLVGVQAGGDIGFEVSPNALDDIWEGALWSLWNNKPIIEQSVADTEITDAGTVADTYAVLSALGTQFVTGMLVRALGFTNAANNQRFRVLSSTATTVVGASLSLVAETVVPITATLQAVGFEGAADDLDLDTTAGNHMTSTLLDFTTLGLVVGEWIKVGGLTGGTLDFATPANNGWYRISAIAANILTFDIVPTGFATEVSAGSLTVQVWMGDYIRNGVIENTYAIERQFQDLAAITYEYFNQMTMGSLALTGGAQAILTGVVSFLGTSSNITETRFSGATDVAAPTNEVMNTSSHVAKIGEGGVEVTGPNFVLGFGININNQLRGNPGIGSVGFVDIGSGEADITGSLATYFGDKTLVEKVINNTQTDLHIALENGTLLKALFMDLPRVKYTAGAPAVPGKNADVTVPLEFGAQKHETLGYTMHVQRHSETV